MRPSGSQFGGGGAGAAEVGAGGVVGVAVALAGDAVAVGVRVAGVGVLVREATALAVGVEVLVASWATAAVSVGVLATDASVGVAGKGVFVADVMAAPVAAVDVRPSSVEEVRVALVLAQPATNEESSSDASKTLLTFLISAVSFYFDSLRRAGLARAQRRDIIACVRRACALLAEPGCHELEEGPMTPKNTRYLILIGLVSLAVVIGLVSLDPLQEHESWLAWLVRGAALLGYWAVFLSILSSAYLRELVRFFGRPFVKVHHVASVTGLALITVHPVAVSINTSSAAVFLPRFDSLRIFLTLGGRFAWYLIGIASLAALLRANLKRHWRTIHYFNYIAFFLASIHATLLGTTFSGQGVRAIILKVVVAALSLVVVYVFVRKQMGRRSRRR